jgi:hypothetical protein
MRIKKSKLLMTFEQLCTELEKRALREIDVCAMHTRFGDQVAYSLSIARLGLFAVLTSDSAAKHVRVITMKLLAGNEKTTDAEIHTVHQDDIRTMAFLVTHFFYEAMRGNDLGDLYSAFPDVDSHRKVVEISRTQIDLSGFPA